MYVPHARSGVLGAQDLPGGLAPNQVQGACRGRCPRDQASGRTEIVPGASQLLWEILAQPSLNGSTPLHPTVKECSLGFGQGPNSSVHWSEGVVAII